MRKIKFRIRFENGKIATCLTVSMDVFYKENPIAKLIEVGNKVISIEQFTGMKDKKGKEIYEGDVVTDGIGKWEVFFNLENGCFWLRNNNHQTGYIIPKNNEVIGNTYDNPEFKIYINERRLKKNEK